MSQLYDNDDVELLKSNIDDITKSADELRFKYVEPTLDKMWDMIYTVRDYLIEKQRKIYGGFALNKLIEEVAPNDKFYDDSNVDNWDIDFYSPDPLGDAREIANRLYNKKYRYVRVVEALHEETYKIYAETVNCADISYIPKIIYSKMPFHVYQGLCLTGPHFLMIDYFRILTDPLISYFRLEKSFTRLYLLQKHFPLPSAQQQIDIKKSSRDVAVAFDIIVDFLGAHNSCISVGKYQYNYLINESQIYKKKKNISYINIDYFEVISTRYINDANELITALQKTFDIAKNRISYVEFYPFFQYLGYSVAIKLDDAVICKIYHHNSRCVPYFDVPLIYFRDKTPDTANNKITLRIGTFSTLILYCLINIARARTNGDKKLKNISYSMISNVTEMRKFYFETKKKTILDPSLFQEFVLQCTGDTNTPIMEKSMRSDKKKKAGKRYSYTYEPSNKNEHNDNKYMFKNSSGNEINNPKNRKLKLNSASSDIVDDEEAEE